MRRVCIVAIIGLVIATNATDAQQTPQTSEPGIALCNFKDDQQMSARYVPVAADRSEGPPVGKLWMPGGSAVTLFTSTKVAVSSTEIPVGAYSIYFIPGKKTWQLIVSKNVSTAGEYEKAQDLVRAPMEWGTLNARLDRLQISFAHSGPKRCEMNVDYGKTKAWITFEEK